MQTFLPAAVAASNTPPPTTNVFRALPRSMRSLGRAAQLILLMAVIISLLVNPRAVHSWTAFAVTYAYTVCYSVGLWLTNGYVVEWLNRHYPWTTQPLRRLLLTLAVSLGGSVLFIVVMNAVLLLIQGQPVARLWSGAMYWRVLMPLIVTVIISLFNHSRSFFFQWRDAAVRAERLEKETAVARLDSLRRQVDPHFLFNSLNALTSLVEENDPARAVRFIRQLAQVYRYVLDSESQELVPLADELKFAESYLYLQKTRLGDALAVEMNLPPAALHPFFVPPLALQLLLENVIKHNTAFQAQPLRVAVTLDAAAPALTVRNTLRPRRLAPGETSGLGLKNLAARYAFLTSKPLAIGEEAGEFVVTLPLLVI
ncbi:sensor histidine kinase [Hymenobacter rubidus]|uniref:sensor histidine kinase n=1 Tax=Hymenobacter rubidus TaxID=1441626 RepID=UPI00191D42AC|nr:histidine kinase [Hymenobacter rubidus]